MRFAKVIGTTVSTVKDPNLTTLKLLVCVSSTVEGTELEEGPFVAVDTVGAGVGEIVLVVGGSGARVSERTRHAPTDRTIVGVVDSIQMGGATTYEKGSGEGGGHGDATR